MYESDNKKLDEISHKLDVANERLEQLLRVTSGLDRVIEDKLHPFGRNGDEFGGRPKH